MGWRFRKSKSLFPGVRLNISRRGLGLRIGPRNAGVSIGPTGTRVSGSIPGTGLSYVHQLGAKARSEPMAAGMIQAECPECGNLNQHRQGSEGLLLKCQHCGFQYKFTITRSSSGCSAWGCLCAIVVTLLAIFVVANLPMPTSPSPQSMQTTALPQSAPEIDQTPPESITPALDVDAEALRVKEEAEMAEQRELENAAKERELRIKNEQAEEKRKAIVATEYRAWSSKDGKFNVTADLVKINELTVTLKRQDNDKEIEVPLEKLSKGDNDYVDNLK